MTNPIFKCRCSQIGKIMTQPKNKSDLISKTTQTFLEQWLKELIYKRKKEFSSKYTEKGIQVENSSIEFASEQLGWGMVFKNDQYFENDMLTGTPDIILNDKIIDVKNSWDCFTFPVLDALLEHTDYYWQVQGYMALTGLEMAQVVYVLSDTPEHLVEDEIRRQGWKMGFIDIPIEFEDEIRYKLSYTDIHPKLKIKTFDVPRNQSDIDFIYSQVDKCNLYLAPIIEQLKEKNWI